MNATIEIPTDPPTRRHRFGEALRQAAFVLLLACVACRPFLAELPFQVSIAQTLASIDQSPPEERQFITPDRTDLSRASFIVLIFLAAALWSLGGISSRKRREPWAGWVATILFAVVAAWGFISCFYASDKYTAFGTWAEQVSLLLAGWLMVPMCGDRRRRAMVVVVLVGLAGAMAAKGLWQWGVEGPQRVADFQANRLQRLAQLGWSPGSAQAAMIEARMRDASPYGYFSLSNLFGSLMILLSAAAVGLAGDKLLAALKHLAGRRRTQKPGEIDVPFLVGLLTAVIAPAALVVLLLTGSMGATISAVVALAGGTAVWFYRKLLARHWRMTVAAVTLLFAFGAFATVAHGLRHDDLPSKTMTFRWYYWTATGRIIADHPWVGVGAGNFPDAYLRYRRPVAEEEVKMPHNVAMHALVQYGAVGGAAYLALLAWVLVLATRPARRATDNDEDEEAAERRLAARLFGSEAVEEHAAPAVAYPRRVSRRVLGLIILISLAVLGARVYFGALSHPILILFDGAFPALAFGLFALLAAWRGGDLLAEPGPVTRIALVAGLAGFFLHNMITYSLWTPGTAMIFWVVAGLCLSYSAPRGRRAAGVLQACLRPVILGGVALTIYAWVGVFHTQQSKEAMLSAYANSDLRTAACEAEEMAEFYCFPSMLNPQIYADAAQIFLRVPSDPSESPEKSVRTAELLVRTAAEVHDPDDYSYWKMAAELSIRAHRLDAEYSGSGLNKRWFDASLKEMAKAVSLNPADAMLRVSYARMLLEAGKAAACLEQLDEAERLESYLNPESLNRFTPSERHEVDELRAAAVAAESRPTANPAASPGT